MDKQQDPEDLQKELNDSQEKFDSIFKLTSAASKVINSDLTILKVNQALVDLLGFSVEEIEGTKILDYACPEYIEHWHNLQQALWAKKLPFFKLDACLVKKDKSIAWVNVTTVLFKEHGDTFGFTILDDITSRKNLEESEKKLQAALEHSNQIQETLRNNEQNLTQILETMAEGVGIIDAEGKMVYANPMAQRILGLSESEIKARTYNDAKWQNLRIDGSPLPNEEHPMAMMMATGMAVYDQEIGVQADGEEPFYISINAAPIFDENGKLTGGIGTFMDVTARRKSIQQKDDFISIASHELKTPVTTLKASLQLLSRIKDNPSPALLSKLIEQSNKSLDKLSALISDLLNANLISQGQLHLRKTNFSLSDLIADCCNHIRTAGTHTITVKGDIDLQIHADEQRIDQVMVNFVNNAVKYAPECKEIVITAERLDGHIKVSVKDDGPGIEPEKLPHLFDRYYRADYSGIQFSGLGLGLYICAEIIKRHGGQIGVDSELGKGATFWFTLPL